MPRPNLSRAETAFMLLLLAYFVIIGYFVLTTHYLFSDEAFAVWHVHDSRNILNGLHSEGRGLAGIYLYFLFRHFDTVEKLNTIRFISLLGWASTIFYLFLLLGRSAKAGILPLSTSFICLNVLFAATSLSFTIYVGWAACGEAFLPALAAFYAGFSLLRHLHAQSPGSPLSWAVCLKVITAGIVSLFFYQPLYPLMLFPFFLLYISWPDKAAFRKLCTAIFVSLLTYLIYYCLFIALLKFTHIPGGDRTKISHDIPGKLGFFFSFPLNQAFNFNMPFNTSSILSQAAFPVLAATWVVLVFTRKQIKTPDKISFLLITAGCWLLAFLPQMIASENFGPYRTMLPLSLFVFATLAAAAEALLKTAFARKIFVFAADGLLLIGGTYNYRHFIAQPLAFEYACIQSYIERHYSPGIDTIIVVRPAENGFKSLAGVGNYKDEFGMPSSSKDWAPDGLVRQLLLEKGVSEKSLQKISVTQRAEDARAGIAGSTGPAVLLIDIPALFKEKYAINGHRLTP